LSKCLNCGENLIGHFCHNCGQKSNVSRLSIKSFFTDILDAVINLDSKYIRTFKALITNPGGFTKNYLSGQRKSFAAPLKYFFIVLALNISVTFILNRPAIQPVEIEWDSYTQFSNQLISLLTNLVMFFVIIPFTIGMKISDRKQEYSFIEQYCFLLYISSQSILIFIFIQLVLYMFGAVLDGPIEGVVWFVEFSFFYFWGYLKLSGKPRKTVLINAIISYLIGILIFLLIVIISGNIVQLFIA